VQKDIHYSATAEIARLAGWSVKERQLLAWADMGTDIWQQVHWYDLLWSRLGEDFHFIRAPGRAVVAGGPAFLRQYLDEISRQANPIALGILLHGLQDTFSHARFIGRFSRQNQMPIFARGGQFALPFAYGHCSVGLLPDVVNANWVDTRFDLQVCNYEVAMDCLEWTAAILSDDETIITVVTEEILLKDESYTARKRRLESRAGVPRFSYCAESLYDKYKADFRRAAKEQVRRFADFRRAIS